MCIYFGFALLCSTVGKKKTAPLSQRTKSETKTNPDMLTIVLCLASVTCICLSFWMVQYVVCVCCNWQITTRDLFTRFTKVHKLCIGHKLCYVLYILRSNCFCFASTALKKTALTRDSNLLTASKESIKKKHHISWWNLVLFPFFIAIFKFVGADVIYAIQLNSKIWPIGSNRPLCLVRMKSRGLGTSYQGYQKVKFCRYSRHFFGFKVQW